MKSLLLLIAGFASTAFAQQTVPLSGKSGRIKISPSKTEIVVEAVLPDLSIRSSVYNGQNFQHLQLSKYMNSIEAGSPELPVYRKLIEIPAGAEVEVHVLEEKTITIDLDNYGTGKLFPAQPSISKSTDPKTVPFQMNQTLYSTDAFIDNELAFVSVVGKMRGKTIGNLILSPFAYNPVTNELIITTEMRVQVLFKNADLKKQGELDKKYFSPLFNGAYRELANYTTPGPTRDEIVTYPTTYVIVSHSMFQATLQPFIQWKRKKGFKVIEAYTNDPAVGTTTTSIKAYLKGLYDNATATDPAPSYVLIVGDIAQVPSFSGQVTEMGDHKTDLYYCEYDGNGDFLPEAYYGRFSASTVAHLQAQIDKTLEYERYEFPDDSFLDHVVLISGVDAGFAPTHGNGQINYGTEEYFNNEHGFTTHVWLYPETEGNVAGDIINTVSQGCGLVNYTAHGFEQGWADPSFEVSDVSTLNNAHKYPTMIGNCCLTNTFSQPTCFGESLLRAANKGAIGYIGGSNVTLWDEDFMWGSGCKDVTVNPDYDNDNLGMYDCIFHEKGESTDKWYVTQSQLIFAGNMAVTASNSSYIHYYWEIYHLMGDPSLMTYLTQADPMTVTHIPQHPLGISSLNVTAEPYAYVAVSANGVLLNAKYTDAGSSVTLNFPPVGNVEELDVVVTKQNRQPYFGKVQLIGGVGTDENTFSAISVYPNPTNDLLHIESDASLNNKEASILIRDIQGKAILHESRSAGSTTISMADFSKGVYTIEWSCEEKTSFHRVIKL